MIPPHAIGKIYPSLSGVESIGQAQTHNGNSRGDGQIQNQLRTRNWPRITNLELQEISRQYPL